jgi:tetratricopeptide (TPR) repeat protein
MRRTAVVLSLVVAAAILPTTRAAAQAAADAQALFDEGVAATQSGDFAAALRAFQAAYHLDPQPDTLYNIGMCHKALGELPAAANAFREYVARAGDQMTPEERTEFDALLMDLVPQIGRITFELNEAGASVTVDGGAVDAGALGGWLAVEPGPHTVAAERDGYSPASTVLDVAAGSTAQARLVLTPVENPVQPTENEGLSQTWFWIAAGAAGAFAIGGAIAGGLEQSAESDFTDAADRCNAGNDAACSEARSIYSDVEDRANATTALLVVAGAAAAAAVTLIFFTDFGGESPPPVAVGVAPIAGNGASGALVDATLRF